MTDYHKAHEAYIRAVAKTLTVAGLEVLSCYANGNDPRDGEIQIEPVGVYTSAGELWLGWSEERGWAVLTVREGAGWNKREDRPEDARFVFEVPAGLIASPETVVAEFAAMAGITVQVPADEFADREFYDHEFGDEDPEFEAALAAYEVTR